MSHLPRPNWARTAQHYACTNTACNTAFPIVDGIPVLLNEQASLFPLTILSPIDRPFSARRPKMD